MRETQENDVDIIIIAIAVIFLQKVFVTEI